MYPQQGILPFFPGFLCFVLHGSHGLEDVWGIVHYVSDVDWGERDSPLHPASAACCVIRQIQYFRDRPAPPPLSSRTLSYGASSSDTY